MKAHQKIQAHKQMLLTLTCTLAVAFGAFASTAAAGNAYRFTSATANRALPPVIGGTYSAVHSKRTVLRARESPRD